MAVGGKRKRAAQTSGRASHNNQHEAPAAKKQKKAPVKGRLKEQASTPSDLATEISQPDSQTVKKSNLSSESNQEQLDQSTLRSKRKRTLPTSDSAKENSKIDAQVAKKQKTSHGIDDDQQRQPARREGRQTRSRTTKGVSPNSEQNGGAAGVAASHSEQNLIQGEIDYDIQDIPAASKIFEGEENRDLDSTEYPDPSQKTSSHPYFVPGMVTASMPNDSTLETRNTAFDTIIYESVKDTSAIQTQHSSVEGEDSGVEGQAENGSGQEDPDFDDYNEDDEDSASSEETDRTTDGSHQVESRNQQSQEESDEDAGLSEALLRSFKRKRGGGPGSRGGRVRQRGGPRGRPRGSGLGRGGLAAMSRLGQKRQGAPKGEGVRGAAFRGRKPGARVADPGPEFKMLQSQAYKAYFQEDFDEAERLIQQAIQANPEVFSAYSLLSEVYTRQGQNKQALDVLWTGAHTRRDAGVWWQVSRKVEEMGDPDAEVIKSRVLYCLIQITGIDRDDYEARQRKVDIYLKDNSSDARGKAFRECRHIMRIQPGNLHYLRIFSVLAVEIQDLLPAKSAWEKAVEFYRQAQNGEQLAFTWKDLGRFLDILWRLRLWEEAIMRTKYVARWLCGRKSDELWDLWTINDAELDNSDEPRRAQIPGFKKGVFSAKAYGGDIPSDIRARLAIFRFRLGSDNPRDRDEGYRHAQIVEYPTGKTPDDSSKVYCALASELFDSSHYSEAIGFFEPLVKAGMKMDSEERFKLAKAYQYTARPTDAISMWQAIVQHESHNVDARLELALLFDSLKKPQEAYEHLNEAVRIRQEDEQKRFEELEKRNNLLKAIEQRDGVMTSGSRAVSEIQKRVHKRLVQYEPFSFDLEEQKERSRLQVEYIINLYRRMGALQLQMQNGDEEATTEWLRHAELLIKDFESMELFFPDDKQEVFTGYGPQARGGRGDRQADLIEKLARRLGRAVNQPAVEKDASTGKKQREAIPDDYKTIPFTEWLHIFCEYAFVSARCRDRTSAYKALTTACNANVLSQDPDNSFHIHLTWVSCALMLRDERTLYSQARWFIAERPNSLDTFCLYSTLCRLHPGRGNWFFSSRAEKFAMRRIIAMDQALLKQGRFDENDAGNQEHSNDNGVSWNTNEYDTSDDEDATPPSQSPTPFDDDDDVFDNEDGNTASSAFAGTKPDAHLLATYAYIMNAASSTQRALNYYFRTWAARDGAHPLLALCITVAYVEMALKRVSSSNRHYYIMLARGFMDDYGAARMRAFDADVASASAARVRGEAALQDVDKREALLRSEIAFNNARFWQMLGLLARARDGYGDCLALAEPWLDADRRRDVDAPPPGFAREAAFALRGLLILAGDEHEATQVTEKWLVF